MTAHEGAITDDSQWYSNPGLLLDAVRQAGRHWARVPKIDGYDNLVEHRRGGQGVVYRGRQRATRKAVALKVLLDGAVASELMRRRFEREIDFIRDLHHPGIIRVLDSGETRDGRLFYAMEYVDGAPLNDGSGDSTLRDIASALELFLGICDAVRYAHQHGVIHRDLKPANIIIDLSGSPRLLDFGLAKVTGADVAESMSTSHETIISRTGQFIGSLAWASPEQVEAVPDRIDLRTDVYSLGVILYHMLTGALPIDVTGNLREALNRILTTDPVRPRTLRREIPLDLETIVLRCLARDPARRYQSVGELMSDLRNFIDGRPIEARRDNTWYVFGKMIRRHSVAATIAAALVIFVVAFSITMSVMYQLTFTAEKEARANLAEANKQAHRSDEVRSFLREMLGSGAQATDGRPLTMREMLDNAALRIESRFSGHPDIRAEVHAVVGESYHSLGHYKSAERHLRQALILYEQELRQDEPAARTMVLLGRTLISLLSFEEADTLLLAALEFNREHFGDHHLQTADNLLSLAMLRRGQVRVHDADRFFVEAINGYRAELPEDHPRLLRATVAHGAFLVERGEYEAAERWLEGARGIVRDHRGEDDPAMIDILMALGDARNYNDRYRESKAYYADAVALQRKLFKEDHPRLADLLNRLGSAQKMLGEFGPAELSIRESIEIAERLLGRRSATYGDSMRWLGLIYRDQGQVDAAEEYLQEALTVRRQVYAPGHFNTAVSLDELGRLLMHLERYGEAVPLLEEAARLRSGIYGPNALFTALTQTYLGSCLYRLDRLEEAEFALTQSAESLAAIDPQSDFTAQAIRALINVLKAQGRDEDVAAWRERMPGE